MKEAEHSKLAESVKVFTDVAKEEKRFTDLLKVPVVLVEGAARVCRMIARSRKSLDDLVINAAKKRDEQAAELRQRGQGLAALSDKALKERLFTMDLTSHSVIGDIAIADARDLDVPWCIAASEANLKMFEMACVRLNHYVFKADFMKQTVARDHKQCDDTQKMCRTAMKQLMDPQNIMRWAAEDHKLMQPIHCYGLRSNYYGLDVHAMATLRSTLAKSGDRAVIAIPFAEARAYVLTKVSSDMQSSLRMNDIIDYIRKMDQDEVTIIGEGSQLPIYHGIIGGGSVLYMPAAFLVFEKALKSGVATGVCSCFAPMTDGNMGNIQSVLDMTKGMDIKGGFQSYEVG